MFRALHIFFLFILLGVAIFAQSDFDEPKWTKVDPPMEEFTMNFPNANIKGSVRSTQRDTSARYLTSQGKDFFAAFSYDSEARSHIVTLKGLAPTDTVPQDVEIDGVKGQRYDFAGSDGYQHSVITIQAPEHFYIFHAIAEAKNDPLAEEFLGSLHFNKKVNTPSVPDSSVQTSSSPSPVSASPGSFEDLLKKPIGGTGNGKDNGIGSGNKDYSADKPNVFDPGAPPRYSKVDAEVAVISKPRPGYSELARQYMISGTVKLRVTFGQDKQVGDVNVLSKLPLGLTQSAISAARQIKFEPALRRGEAYTTTKALEYSFNIY